MKNSCTLSRAALVVPSGTDWRSRCEGKFRQGLGNPLANYSHGSGLGSRTSSILARVCSCFVSATPLREWKDRDDVSQSELRHAFADGWEIESLEPVRLEIRPEYRQQGVFFGEDPRSWFLIARRLA